MPTTLHTGERPRDRRRRSHTSRALALALIAECGLAVHSAAQEPPKDAAVAIPKHQDLQSAADLLRAAVTPISGGLGLADVAVVSGDELPADVRVLALITQPDGSSLEVPLARSNQSGPARSWRARVMVGSGETPDRSVPASLSFRLALIARDGGRFVGPSQTAAAAPPKGDTTPDWAKGAVWYQVFVERFRNGNPSNDPQPPEFFHAAWNSDWDTVSIDELELARARAAELPMPQSLNARRRGGQLGNVLNARRYGGDLEGLVEKLDELRDLGITALYLNPIFDAHSHHKYDASDYRHIDPGFAGVGRTDDERAALARETANPATWIKTAADRYFLDVFIPEVRKRNMRIVLDGVWNHVGIHHWAFQDVLARGADSPYKDWFQCTFATEADFPNWKDAMLDVRPGRLIGWKSWGDRNGGLPEFSRNLKTGRLHPEVEQHIWEATRRWTQVTDGWRLDVVPDVPLPFWRAWSDHVRSINPDAALFCEVWFDAKDYYTPPVPSGIGTGRIFDGQMNYPFAFAAVQWLAGEPEMPSAKLIAQFRRVFSHTPATDLVQMNLLGSHDTERLASMLANPGRAYDQEGSPATNRRYDDSRPTAEIYRRVVLAVALQSLHMGSPMVYNGDEYGMFGADDPHCRKPVPWPDRGPYEDPQSVHEPGLREQFRGWLKLRADASVGPALRYGSIRYVPSDNPDVLVFERQLNDTGVTCVINRNAQLAFDAASLLPAGARPCGPTVRTGDAAVGALQARAWWSRQP